MCDGVGVVVGEGGE